MKQIKIEQYFLNEIISERKTFEIRKDAYLDGIVELAVIEHIYFNKEKKYCDCTTELIYAIAKEKTTRINKCIKDSLIVKLTKKI